MPLNTEQCYSCQRFQKCIKGPQYRVMLLISEVLKVHKGPSIQYSAYRTPQYRAMLLMLRCQNCIQGPSIQSNVTHFEGVKSRSIYTIRAVMLCMSNVSKEAQNGLTHLCL